MTTPTNFRGNPLKGSRATWSTLVAPYSAEAIHPDGSALAPMSAAGT
jgi:hypothetical protein